MKRRVAISVVLLAAVLASVCFAQNAPKYEIAVPGYQYRFPRDDFNHPNYQTEWWYYTGNLWTPQGRRFGFELTFFRIAVSREPGAVSVWNVHDVYAAHAALSDIKSQEFYDEQRLNRAGPGLAGIDESSGTISNGNWKVVWRGDEQSLEAITEKFALTLTLHSEKPPVIQGVDGVSQKAPGRGHASHYISLTRLGAQGTVRLSGRSYVVKGFAWMDHEFFTELPGTQVAGWDWTYFQFDDHTELMVYRLRRKDGSESPYSAGTYVDAKGHSRHLTAQDFQMQDRATWTSPTTRARYPVNCQVEVPSLGIKVTETTPLKNQELVGTNRFTPTYWEGAIDVSGIKAGKPIHGVGYLELTGYTRSLRLPAAEQGTRGSERTSR